MHEIAELADDCSVFRNGRKIATYEAGTRSDNEVVEMMIGREYSHVFPPKSERVQSDEPPVVEVRPTVALRGIRAGQATWLGVHR
jgi:ribose transport system ATP-binding protein